MGIFILQLVVSAKLNYIKFHEVKEDKNCVNCRMNPPTTRLFTVKRTLSFCIDP